MIDLIKRMVANMLAILQTRAELLAIEVEEEVLRFFSYLILSLVALVCFGIATLLAILLIIVVFWDSNRVTVIACLTAFFGVAAIVVAMGVRNCFRSKPKFLSNSMGEISKDIEMLRPSDQEQAR